MDEEENNKTYKSNKAGSRQIEIDDDSFLMSPKNDFCFKRIFGDENNKDILRSFLSAIMRIKLDKFEDLVLKNTEIERDFEEDKKGILDVRAKLKDDTEIDIEIQLNYTKYMAHRTLFYWSKMYTENIKKGDTYSVLKKCVTINILDFIALPLEQLYSKFYLKEDKTNYKLTDVLEIYYLELPKLKHEGLKHMIDLNDPVVQWMLFLDADNQEVLAMLAEKNLEIKKAKNILKVMSKSEEERRLYNARQAWIRDVATAREEGLEEGLEKGLEEGLEKGLEKGIENEKRNTAKKLLLEGVEIPFIEKITELTKEEIRDIKELL